MRKAHHWQGISQDFNPEGYEGFVYLITNLLTGKKYIGRKYFFSRRKIKQAGTKRRKSVVTEADWQNYKSSCTELKADIKLLGHSNFIFEILSLHTTRAETNYTEVKEQFGRDVLQSKMDNGEREYYNGNILSRYFVPKEVGTPEHEKKCENISRGLTKYVNSPDYVHPMKGKVHPNKGKKLPQTGHNKGKGRVGWTNGVTSIKLPKGQEPPVGYYKGMIHKKLSAVIQSERIRATYASTPKKCEGCGEDIPYERRYWKGCTKICTNKIRTKNTPRRVGKENPTWKHYYNTPLGKFTTAKEASLVHNCSAVTIRNRCKYTDEVWKDWFITKV